MRDTRDAKTVAGRLIEAKKPGRIVNISSVGVLS